MATGYRRREPGLSMVYDYVSLLLAIIFPCLWIEWGGLSIGLREISATAVFAVGAWLVGLSFHRIIGSFRVLRASFPLIYVTGAALLSVGMFILKMGVGLSLSLSALVLPAIAAFLLATRSKDRLEAGIEGRYAGVPLAATFLSFLGATLWASHLFPESLEVAGGVRSHMFIEYYAHGVNVLPLLGPGTPFSFGSPHFVDQPWSFYHLGSHLYPAYLSEWTGQPLTRFLGSSWHPFGFSLLGMGAFVLSSVLAGTRHGLWGVVVVSLLPDPTFWSWELICFSFLRNAECTPAASLGCALGAVALALVVRGSLARSTRITLAGFALAALVLFIRANFLFCILPTCAVALVLARNDWPRAWTLRMTAFIGCVGLVAAILLSQLKSAPTLDWNVRGGEPFAVWSAGVLVERTAWTDLVPAPGDVSIAESILRRSVFLLLGGFQGGLYVLAFLWLVMFLRGKTRGGILLAPLALLSFFLFVGLFASPNRNGDPFEIPHRPFIWYYYALAIWTGTQLGRLVQRLGVPSLATSVLAALLAVIPAYQIGSTLFVPFDPKEHFIADGWLDATRFIRKHSERTERFVDSERDPLLISGACAERPEFVCWGEGYNFPGLGAASDIRAERSKEVHRLLSLSSEQELANWLVKYRVRWVLVHPQSHLGWPSELAHRPTFQSKGYRVYDLATLLETIPAPALSP